MIKLFPDYWEDVFSNTEDSLAAKLYILTYFQESLPCTKKINKTFKWILF